MIDDSEFPPTLANLPDRALFRLWVAIMMELRCRDILRSFNSPTGDYAEWLVGNALGLTLENNSAAGFDAVGPDGTRYQIKARWLATKKSTRQLSAIRNLHANPFDVLVVVLFGPEFEVAECWHIPAAAVREHAQYVAHVNGHRLFASGAVLDDPRTVRLHQMEDPARES